MRFLVYFIYLILAICMIVGIFTSCRSGNDLYNSNPKAFNKYNEKVGR